jgi:hypothetical protein
MFLRSHSVFPFLLSGAGAAGTGALVNVSSPITFGYSARAPDVSPGSGDLVIVEGDPSGSSSTRRGSASRSQVLQEVCSFLSAVAPQLLPFFTLTAPL